MFDDLKDIGNVYKLHKQTCGGFKAANNLDRNIAYWSYCICTNICHTLLWYIFRVA